MANDLLLYSNAYWEEKLGNEFRKNNLENKLHLIFSLLVFLEISLAQFLTFAFSSKIEKVKARAGHFMGYTESANNDAIQRSTPQDRPLPPKKTNARPFGVFDVNEGSKTKLRGLKGCWAW
jgi:hypothetical protein